jgi:hypothetical protein
MSDKTKKVKKQKHKIKKGGSLKNKSFALIEVDGGFCPRDINFPVGAEQFFTSADVEAV